GRADQLLPLEQDAALGMMRHRIGQQLQHRQRRHRLPRPALADQRDGLAFRDLERDPAHGLHLARTAPEGAGQIADGAEGLVHRATVFFGSTASRTASPMKISSVSMMAVTANAVMPSQGDCGLALPCRRISPREGDPGGNPKPRKSRLAKALTEPARVNGKN